MRERQEIAAQVTLSPARTAQAHAVGCVASRALMLCLTHGLQVIGELVRQLQQRGGGEAAAAQTQAPQALAAERSDAPIETSAGVLTPE